MSPWERVEHRPNVEQQTGVNKKCLSRERNRGRISYQLRMYTVSMSTSMFGGSSMTLMEEEENRAIEEQKGIRSTENDGFQAMTSRS